MRKRISVMVIGLLASLALISYVLAADGRPGSPAQRVFRLTTQGQALEARGGVPVSGVVLFEPTGEFTPGNPLDDIGTNQRCNQDAFGNNQNETPICASPANTNNVMAGSNDYRNGDASGGFYRTTNGGTTWSDALVTRGPAGVFEAAGDPVTAVDSTGRMYAAYIAFDRTTDDNGIYVQTSTNNGTTWSTPVTVVEHTGCGVCDFEDKPYAGCDYSSASPYRGNYYISWTKFRSGGGAPIYFSRSTNGGTSFSAPVQISTSTNTQFSCPTVGPNGEVYVVWYNFTGSTIRFDKSTDGGVTWGTDITVSSFDDDFPANPCGSFRTPSYPVVACDISTGPRRGWIYVAWADARNGNPDIYFSRSTNGGTSWSAASRVDNDATGRWQWWQWMQTNPTTGDIGLSWHDRREDPAGCQYKAYATVSADGGSTWAANFAISSVASNPSSSTFLGDYTGTSFRSNGFYGVWVDLRNDGGDAYANWFNVTSTPTITVTSPNGGENWIVDDVNNITWTSTNLSENVRIEINRTYPSVTWTTIIASTPNDGTHPWTVTTPTSTTARVRITGTVQTTVGDTSNANFTIGARSLTVTAPNGGEVWIVSETSSITWTSQNLSEEVQIQIKRTYPSDPWETIIASTPNDGSHPWLVTGPVTSTARVRILGTVHATVGDTSNANFTISTRSLTVTIPNGGEVWTVGENRNITWTSQNVPGNVSIDLNYEYPTGGWQPLTGSTPNDGVFEWVVMPPISTAARVRITSVSYLTVSDVSDNNFAIREANQPPVIVHDPLHDQLPASFSVTALVTDDLPGVITRILYRPVAGSYDSLTLAATGNPNEFAATLGPLAEQTYEYFLRAYDVEGAVTVTPTSLFEVGSSCGSELGYDDGSAEASQWSYNTDYQWAVRFDPGSLPFVACAARMGISAVHPDSSHSVIEVQVLLADGIGGAPGTLVLTKTVGSVGNVIGGVPDGDNWTYVVLRDALDNPLTLTDNFYIAVSNPASGAYESFLHDTSSARQGHSYVYDPCDEAWYSETSGHPSARGGNRLIRVSGYSLVPPTVVIMPAGNDIRLHWTNLHALSYDVFSATSSDGPFGTYEGSTPDTTFLDVNALASPVKFYVVNSSSTP